MSELFDKFIALIEKDVSEHMLAAADMIDEAAQSEEVKQLPTDVALAAISMAMRNEAGKKLSKAPVENLSTELGKLVAEVEQWRVLGKARP